jgi:glycosyltransferase involved in cell wall biosynthesis
MYGGDDADTIKKKRFGKLLVSQILKANSIFSMNDLMGASYVSEGFPKEKIFKVANPVNIKKFKPLEIDNKKKLKKNIGLEENSFVFITSGIISTRKRQAFITESFLEFIKKYKYSNSYLLHMGPRSKDLRMIGRYDVFKDTKSEEGKILKMLDKDKNELVRLIGNQKYPENYLNLSNVFVHASLFEGNANVVNEAYSSGLPVIVPKSKLYTDNTFLSCTLFFDSTSKDSLVENMNIYYKESNKKSKNARSYAISSLSPKIISQKYVEIIKNVYHTK